MCMHVLPAYMSVHHVLAGCLWKPGEGMSSASNGFKELTNGCLETQALWKSSLCF